MTKIGVNCSPQWLISGINNHHAFRVDAYPRQEGLLSFNSDMVWYRRKTKMFVDPQNASTTTLVFFCFFEYLTLNVFFLMMPINFLTLIIAGWSCGVITIHGVSSREEYKDSWWSRALCGENYNFIRRARENHWACVTWSSIRASIFSTRVSHSSVKCWNSRQAVEAEEYSQQMAERGHGMYYTPQTFAQYLTHMYQYPF